MASGRKLKCQVFVVDAIYWAVAIGVEHRMRGIT